jgi:hypothetical protein
MGETACLYHYRSACGFRDIFNLARLRRKNATATPLRFVVLFD